MTNLTLRRQSRELALQVLFQTEFTPKISYGTFLEVFEHQVDPQIISYADELVVGVTTYKNEIDAQIQSSSSHWKLDRMATIDRNILRIAVYEMKFAKEALKENIAINEAVEIAKKFGTTESAAFVNGLLDQVGKGR